MYLTEVEPDEIKTQMQNLTCKKASDIFGISANFLKFAGGKITQPLTFLFSESIISRIVPKKLKLEVVYPIHKKNSKMKVNSCRPTSILSMISKIYEKLSFFTKNKAMHNHKFGFQKGNLFFYGSLCKYFKSTRKERKSMLHILRFCKGLSQSK